MSIYDDLQAVTRGFLEEQWARVMGELAAESTAKTTALARVGELEAEADKLRARIVELEKPASPWRLLYKTDFTRDDGWSERDETQSNDNSANKPANVQYTPEGLVILGRRETYRNRPYTSGDVLGKHVSIPNEFRGEVVAAVPWDKGMWSAPLWFRPLTGPNVDQGEIDLAEMWATSRANPVVKSTLHSEYGATHKQDGGQLAYAKLAVPDPSGFHTYVIEKTSGRIVTTCDGVVIKDWKRDTVSATTREWWDRILEVPDRTWYPRATLQIGGSGAGEEPDASWRESRMVIRSLTIEALA